MMVHCTIMVDVMVWVEYNSWKISQEFEKWIYVSYQQFLVQLTLVLFEFLNMFTELQQKIPFGGGFAFTWREPESTAVIHGIQRPSELSKIVNMGDLCLYVI